MSLTITDFQSPILPTWCPGCGDFAIWSAIKQALVQEQIGPMDVVLCYDIGCNSNMADKINAYVFKGLHGRVLPLAAGISIANQNLPVIAVAGDGGTLDEGMHHFIHSFRSNYNLTFILHNNCDFGLTTGQATPTTPTGQKMNSAANGVVENRLNPVQLAHSAGASFIGRGFTGNVPQLVSLIRAAIKHPGFSYLDMLQHCPTYNKFQDHKWLAERVYDVTNQNIEIKTREQFLALTDYQAEKIATGILWQEEESIPYLQRLSYRRGSESMLKDEVKKYDVSPSFSNFV